MEEVSEEYLGDIIERNLIFVHKYDSFGKPKRCGIHDLFREICIREARKENFLYILNRDVAFDPMEISGQRRLILGPNIIEDDESPCSSIVSRDGSCSATRSLICLGDCKTSSSTIRLASGLLKVLNIRMEFHKFPVESLELVNLKYLELGHVLEIPSSISRLRNLQTLIACAMKKNFMPSKIWEMSHLRHLQTWKFFLSDIPDVQCKWKNAYILKSLETVSKVVNFRCTQEVLRRIPNLKKLNIEYRRDPVARSSLKNLVHFCQLESLRCESSFGHHQNILPKLAFPFSLKKLVLVGRQIPWEQMSIIGVLPNLEVLKLKSGAMVGHLWETNDEEFKQLKFLLIHDSHLKEWKTENDHFPSLRHLRLELCKGLKAIPSEIGEIPTLETIKLVACSRAAESSLKKMLEEEEDPDIKIIISDDY